MLSLPETILLGAIAGFTIFLGLPVARLRRLSKSWQAFLNALATGILVFLLWDILSKANEPIAAALDVARKGQASDFANLLALFVTGIGLGLLGLVYFERLVLQKARSGDANGAQQLALMIATGIGLHNFSEGLAIGQAAREGAIGLALILIVGFGLHNMTEGFGIAAPLAGGPLPSWAFLGLAGFIGGGPTFLGTVIGTSFTSPGLFVFCLALAAGSILYVVRELLHVGRKFQLPELATWGVFLGLIAGFGTDLVLTWAGV
jgi:ZIP family zinc transporter